MQEYEDSLCPSCGQPLEYAMDPDLAEEWTTMPPVRDHACSALHRAHEANRGREQPEALRYAVGMRAGWEERKAALVASRAERAASGEPQPE